MVTIANGMITIVPHANNQSWIVKTDFDGTSCAASIDFHVPGKPGYPPVNLTATSYVMQNAKLGAKYAFEFTDPSGTLAKPDFPLNAWIQLV